MTVDGILLFQKFLGALCVGVVLVVVALAVAVLVDKYRNPIVEEESDESADVAHEARALPHSE